MTTENEIDEIIQAYEHEIKRLHEGIKSYLLRYLPEELEHHELKELIE